MAIIFLFLIGFGLAVSGGVTIIAYMNFLPAGVSWMEYLLFIGTRVECYLLPIGLILMALSISRFPKRL
ncbi:hypothetical protein P5G51_012965 [Virgibacillus sp. 179-BFC.A HS]|uniref:Uncharacterized protein n=1 Tax=Tigheibacillus jepli TaxID=3035914 RepID=A0ABU5CIM6_9BACI|nr:hypothetical protein [Virgibacillus sp. 179-BFC.A HS]MDY0406179.1 hypothetical protein [Virgibacillus sp. 179-BFC.A HS]